MIKYRHTHQKYTTGFKRFKGNLAEHEYCLSDEGSNIKLNHPFMRSKELPFVCATPDFIING